MAKVTKEDVYDKIIKWEHEAGESLLDSGFDLREHTFMTWCFGKGYINRAQYNAWIENKDTLEGCDANYYVYDSYGDVPWAIVSSEDWNDEDNEKAYMILAEFISEIDVYINRLNEFIIEGRG